MFITLAIILVAIIISLFFIPVEFLTLAEVLCFVVVMIGAVAFGIKHPSNQKPRRRRKRYHSNDEYWTGLPWMGGVKKKRKNFWED